MNALNILYQSNDAFAPLLGVSLSSLLKNAVNIEKLKIYIINKEICADNISKIENLCHSYQRELIWISAEKIENLIAEYRLPPYKGFRKNNMSIMKIFAGEFIQAERLLYLDCDTIVTGNIGELAGLDMKNYPAGMVQDSIIPTKYKQQIGFSKEDNYYNSGIIYFDLVQWKKQRCLQRIADLAQTGVTFGTVDQDYINVALKNNIYTLDFKYNVQCMHFLCSPECYKKYFSDIKPSYEFQSIKDGCLSPCIVHYEKFCGMLPFHANSVHPCTKLFDIYLKETDWNDSIKRPTAEIGFAMKIERILFLILPRFIFIKLFKIASDHSLIMSGRQKYSK